MEKWILVSVCDRHISIKAFDDCVAANEAMMEDLEQTVVRVTNYKTINEAFEFHACNWNETTAWVDYNGHELDCRIKRIYC